MEITIRHFGPIDEFVFDLSKDLIVTYGDNNIGKSYAMQIVYLLLKSFNEYFSSVTNYFDGYYYFYRYGTRHFSPKGMEEVRSTVNKFADSKQRQLDITKTINSCIIFDIRERLYSSFINSCQNTFGDFKGILSQKPQIILVLGSLSITFHLGDSKQAVQSNLYTYPTTLKKASSDFHKSRNANGHLDIYYYNNVESGKFSTHSEYVRFRERINRRDTLGVDFALTRKPFRFRGFVCHIEYEIPPNPIIKKWTQ